MQLTTLLLKLLYEPDFKQTLVHALLPLYKAHLLHNDTSGGRGLPEAINRLHVQLFTDPVTAASSLAVRFGAQELCLFDEGASL